MYLRTDMIKNLLRQKITALREEIFRYFEDAWDHANERSDLKDWLATALDELEVVAGALGEINVMEETHEGR